MTDRILELLLEESRWLFSSMLTALICVVALSGKQRRKQLPRRVDILWAMCLFYGCTLGMMSFGHLLAVAIKSFQGTLQGSLWILVPMGLVLTVPAWWMVFHVGRVQQQESWRSKTVGLNAWLGVGLLGLGLHNFPLALPAALNIAFQLHTKRNVGRVVVTAAIVANIALFAGAFVFMASGQSFEQFKDMPR